MDDDFFCHAKYQSKLLRVHMPDVRWRGKPRFGYCQVLSHRRRYAGGLDLHQSRCGPRILHGIHGIFASACRLTMRTEAVVVVVVQAMANWLPRVSIRCQSRLPVSQVSQVSQLALSFREGVTFNLKNNCLAILRRRTPPAAPLPRDFSR